MPSPIVQLPVAAPLQTPPLSEPLSVRNAILTIDIPPSSSPVLEHLPLGPTLHASQIFDAPAVAMNPVELPSELPDPLQFEADPATKPVWLSANSKQPFSPIEQTAFERPLNEEPRSSFARIPQQATAIEADEPVIISDFSDTPESLLAQARQQAAGAASTEQLSSVAELCRQVVESKPSSALASSARRLAASVHNRRGELLLDAGRQQEALNDFEAAIALDHACSAAIHNRAVTLAQQLDFDSALADFNRVIELNPGLAIAYRNRAELFAAQGKLDDAVADYTRAVDAMPDDAELYRARAHALQSLGDFDRAIADLNRSIQLDPQAAQNLAQRGNIMAERGDFDHALADFKQAVAIDPQLADAHRSLAWLYATCPEESYRDSEKALAAAQQAVTLSEQDDYFALESLAAAQANAEQFDAAVETQQQALHAAPAQSAEPIRQRLALYEQRQAYRSQILSSDSADH